MWEFYYLHFSDDKMRNQVRYFVQAQTANKEEVEFEYCSDLDF